MPRPSLRRTLQHYLLLVLLPTLLAGSALTYYIAVNRVRDAFDLGLLDVAEDIAQATTARSNHLFVTLPDVVRDMLKTVNQDRVIYAVWDDQRRLVTGDARLLTTAAVPEGRASAVFDSIEIGARDWRRVLLRGTHDNRYFYVAVARTTGAMFQIRRNIFLGVFIFGSLLTAVALIGVYVGIRKGLTPIATLCREIGLRSSSNLTPLDSDLSPHELRPIVHNVNALMEQLERSLRGHRRFIADAAHQLRTPLAALDAQIAVAQLAPASEAHAALQQLAATTQRAGHLANQLLSLARLEHAQLPRQHMETVDLQEALGTVLPGFVIAAERSGIELQFDVRPCHLIGHRILLQELLSNLLDNAIRYVPRGGLVDMEAYLDEQTDTVRLTISDDGPGVDDEMLTRLGTPFFRGGATDADGCGLGLAIAGEIVRLHGGEIRFARATPRGGLRIDIDFPTLGTPG